MLNGEPQSPRDRELCPRNKRVIGPSYCIIGRRIRHPYDMAGGRRFLDEPDVAIRPDCDRTVCPERRRGVNGDRPVGGDPSDAPGGVREPEVAVIARVIPSVSTPVLKVVTEASVLPGMMNEGG